MDKIQNCNGKWLDVNINADRLNCEKDQLDFTLIENFQTFVFDGEDYYSGIIIEMIKSKYPSKHVHVIRGKQEFKKIENILPYRFIYIYSGSAPCIKHEYSYSSLQIMSSLCWIRHVTHPGKEDRTVLLINIGFGKGCGLGFIIRTVNTLVAVSKLRGWEKVISLGDENMYINSSDEDMWKKYFVVDEKQDEYLLKNSKNVIDLRENNFSYLSIYHNPYFYEMWEDVEAHSAQKLAPCLMAKFQEKSKWINSKKGILGVIIRGTDGVKFDNFQTQIQFLQEQCRSIMETYGYSHLFLATEDRLVFESFKVFFKENLIYINQKRVIWSDVYQTIGEALATDDGDNANWGETYLYITYCLSRCQTLAYNIKSGAYYLAKMFSDNLIENEYELRLNPTEQDVLDNIVKRLEKSESIAIYGIGCIGEKLCNYLSSYRNRIILCDKRAGEISIKDADIITPEEMLKCYFKKGINRIIVTSEKYSEEIQTYLLERGVSAFDIVIYPYNGCIF